MSQPPGSGAGPYGPQGQNPYGQQPGQNPYGQQPPGPQQPSPYGQQPPAPPQPSPYSQQPQTPAYGQQPQTPAYGQQPQTPAYGQQPGGGTAQQPYPPAPTPPAYPTPPSQATPSYGASAPSATPPPASPAQGTPVYGSQTPSSYGSPTPPPSFPSAPTAPQATPPAYGGTPSATQPYGGPQAPTPPGPYAPGQTGQGWSNDPRPPQAYAPVPGAFPPAPPAKKKSRTGLVIGVVAAVLVLLVGGGYLVSQAMKPTAAPTIATSTPGTTTGPSTSATPTTPSASATSSASGYPGFTQSGSTLTGSNFTTSLPTGWTLSTSNGGKNEGEIIDQNNNLLDYFSDFQRNAKDNCAYQASAIASASGVETAQPPVAVTGAMWGSEPAEGVEVTLKRASQTQQEVIGYYCLDHAGVSVLVRSISWLADRTSVQSGAKQLLAAWKWS